MEKKKKQFSWLFSGIVIFSLFFVLAFTLGFSSPHSSAAHATFNAALNAPHDTIMPSTVSSSEPSSKPTAAAPSSQMSMPSYPASSLSKVKLVAGNSFSFSCPFSHAVNDDPLMFLNQPGVSMLHDFYGSTVTDAFTTPALLFSNTKETTCTLPFDKSAYWTPAVYENDARVLPLNMKVTYSSRGVHNALHAFPKGFSMIAGDETATTPQNPQLAGWKCNNTLSTLPVCTSKVFSMQVSFPNCWDGKKFAPMQTMQHMVYAAVCPSSFPVAVPGLTIEAVYPAVSGSVKLSIGPDFEGNSASVHADFMNNWQDVKLKSLLSSCLTANAVNKVSCRESF